MHRDHPNQISFCFFSVYLTGGTSIAPRGDFLLLVSFQTDYGLYLHFRCRFPGLDKRTLPFFHFFTFAKAIFTLFFGRYA